MQTSVNVVESRLAVGDLELVLVASCSAQQVEFPVPLHFLAPFQQFDGHGRCKLFFAKREHLVGGFSSLLLQIPSGTCAE
jgi:hypothetical protein